MDHSLKKYYFLNSIFLVFILIMDGSCHKDESLGVNPGDGVQSNLPEDTELLPSSDSVPAFNIQQLERKQALYNESLQNYTTFPQVLIEIILHYLKPTSPILGEAWNHFIGLNFQTGQAYMIGPRASHPMRDGSRKYQGFFRDTIDLPPNHLAHQVVIGAYHMAVLSDSSHVLIKRRDNLSMNDGTHAAQNIFNQPDGLPIPDVDPVKQIIAGKDYTIALTHSGQVYGIGGNTYGQLGDGSTEYRASFVPAQGLPEYDPVEYIAAGHYHTLALTQHGQVYVTGLNKWGQLGRGGHTSNQNFFVQALGLPPYDPVKEIATKSNHTVALTESGQVYTTGCNTYGQLGDRSNNHHNIFVAAQGLPLNEPAKLIVVGDHHTLVLTQSGQLYAAGCNFYGQLGDGSENHRNFFVRTRGLPSPYVDPVQQVVIGSSGAGGDDHTVVLTQSGVIYATGCNSNGQLGDGSKRHRNIFTQALPLPGFEHANLIKAVSKCTAVFTLSNRAYATNRDSFEELEEDHTVHNPFILVP